MVDLIRPRAIDYGMSPEIARAMQSYAQTAGMVPEAIGEAIATPLQAFGQVYEERQAAQAERQRQALAMQALTGDPEAQRELMAVDPEAALQMQQTLETQAESERAQMEFEAQQEERQIQEIGRYGNIISTTVGEKKREVTQRFYDRIIEEGGDPAMFGIPTREAIAKMSKDELDKIGQTAQSFAIEPEELRKLEKPEAPLVQVGVGPTGFKVPAGYMVDPADPTKVIPIPGTKLAEEMRIGKFTEGQSSAANFANRMVEADLILDDFAKAGETASGFLTAVKRGTGVLGRYAMSPAEQSVIQAQDDWIRAKLRKESGAVIGKEEMEQERATYFPEPGDSPAVIKQKARARKSARKGMIAQSGGAYNKLFQKMTPQERGAPAEEGDITQLSQEQLLQLYQGL